MGFGLGVRASRHLRHDPIGPRAGPGAKRVSARGGHGGGLVRARVRVRVGVRVRVRVGNPPPDPNTLSLTPP